MSVCSMIALSLPLLAGEAALEHQHLVVTLDPSTHTAAIRSRLDLSGEGELHLRVAAAAHDITIDAPAGVHVAIDGASTAEPHHLIRIRRDHPDRGSITLSYEARFEQDVEAGEVEGQIHNKSVSAHIGENGIFLSDGAAWHPQWLDERRRPRLVRMSVDVTAIDGWSIVASGDPVAHLRSITDPVWNWATPRPVDGMAIVGNRHVMVGESHMTAHGPVSIVMHVTPEHETLAPLFIDAAKSYLDLYVPLLGAFPYRRFSIVENFFSSGFAYPGFTVLGPQVVGMAPRSLAPGYLDHELVHNWWGNGVYVDPDDGNWCEALTTYCANYYRRIADEGEDDGRTYRRGVLMKLSTDPATLDNGPLDAFGRDPGLDRFVGYDKGAFVFAMLEGGGPYAPLNDDRAAMFRALRRFAETNMGEYAGWDDLRAAFEAEFGIPLGPFFETWVRTHTTPDTSVVQRRDGLASLGRAYGAPLDGLHIRRGVEDGRTWIEFDPEFRLYRTLPPAHLVPTIAGTQGPGGLRVETGETRSEVMSYLPRLDALDEGENLVLIGAEAIGAHDALIKRTSDPITVGAGTFRVGGITYDASTHAVLHSMHHPDRPGRYVTVFHSNGEVGWSRLRLIGFYTRDTTIVWDEARVIDRRVFEPERQLWLDD